jgi:hypothetical protein
MDPSDEVLLDAVEERGEAAIPTVVRYSNINITVVSNFMQQIYISVKFSRVNIDCPILYSKFVQHRQICTRREI